MQVFLLKRLVVVHIVRYFVHVLMELARKNRMRSKQPYWSSKYVAAFLCVDAFCEL